MDDFIKRMDDLSRRSETRSIETHSGFLTPAECYEAERAFRDVYLYGGGEDCERKMAFFLPDYMTAEDFDWFGMTGRCFFLPYRSWKIGAAKNAGTDRPKPRQIAWIKLISALPPARMTRFTSAGEMPQRVPK